MKTIRNIIERIKTINLPIYFWNRLFVVFLVLSGILLVLISFNSLGDKVSGLAPIDEFRDNTVIIKPPNVTDISQPELISTGNCPNCVTITFEAQHFFPKERQLDGVVHIDIPNSIKEKLWSNFEYIATPDTNYPNRLVLKDEYKDSKILFSTVH
jgi:hypothetical protein